MGKIQKLPQNLINLIAAGEVVERPASALKELMENSIDANASIIVVKLQNYGIDSIQIQDNGIGMIKEDAIMAFEQHATSKIKTEEDLSKILTMGFRGEALASISSVAGSIDIETKTEKETATKLLIKQTNIKEVPTPQAEQGTTIRINNLFENIPARKKFLKSHNTEYKYLIDTFINVALPYTNIHFELHHNNKLVHKLTKSNSIKDRIFEIWGGLAKGLFTPEKFESTTLKIEGVFGNSQSGRKTSPIQYIYLNNRFILNKTISAAVNEGYSGFINKELKPTYFLFLSINPSDVDVNIHPRKLEAKFTNSEDIFRSVLALTKKTLEINTKQIINNTLTNQATTQKSESTRYYESFLPTNRTQTNNQTLNKNSLSPQYTHQKGAQSISQALTFTKELLTPPLLNQQEHTSNTSYKPFQIFNTYIVFEKEDKVVLLDQHAAAEKIMFEKLVKNLGKLNKKPLLVAEIINIKKEDKEQLIKNKANLEEIGFIIEDFGSDSIQVLEIPELLNQFNIEQYIDSIINPENDINNNFGQFETYNGIKLTRDLYLMIATAACHSSVRAGQKLTEAEMLNILKDLNLLYNPYNCPHGRPVIWELSKYEIEKNFRRKL